MYPELTSAFLRDESLVRQSIESFDKFVDEKLQEIIDAQSVIEPQVTGLSLKLGRIRVEKPVIREADGSIRSVFPMEARQRDLTYSADLFLEITQIRNGIEGKTEEVPIGALPVMTKSKLCRLHGLGTKELVEVGEDPRDLGGYFVINGTEKVLMTIEDLAPNRILVSKEDETGTVQAKVFSTRLGFRGRITVDRTKDGKLALTMPSYSKSIELILSLRALGLVKDDKILEAFSTEKEIVNDILLNLESEEANTQKAALETIGKRAAPGQPVEYQLKRAELLLDRYLLPHIGVEEKDRMAKAYYLCRMAERAILVANGVRVQDDKDHYANKRLKIPGKLMEELFRYAFQFLVKDIAYQVERANVRGRKMSMYSIVRPDALSERIKYSMATGNWAGGHTGVCQPLERTNAISAVSYERRIISPLAKKHPHYKARDLNGTHYGRLDPNETPEGPNCGLIKNLSLSCEVTTGTSERAVETALRRLGVTMRL
jgi:DNA-directed RNA polymerase beta subunit